MNEETLDAHIAAFLACRGVLEDLAAVVEASLAPLLRDPRLSVHSIAWRIKSVESLREKLARPDKTYHRLTDVTDLVGLRVITYFEDGVEVAARHVEDHLEVDLAHSVDRRGQAGIDRFGYRSLHYVCRPPRDFAAGHAPPLEGLRYEVQLRTILQHAWAEIEHDMGYKSDMAIPPAIRRRFSRLAGLLELADESFLSIKRDIQDYEARIAAQVQQGSGDVPLDHHSLLAFIDDPLVTEVDLALCEALALGRSEEVFFPDYLVKMLSAVGIDRIGALRELLLRHREGLVPFLEPYFRFASSAWGLSIDQLGPLRRGYCLLFLAHRVLRRMPGLEVEKVTRVSRFFSALDRVDEDTARELAVKFLQLIEVDDRGGLPPSTR